MYLYIYAVEPRPVHKVSLIRAGWSAVHCPNNIWECLLKLLHIKIFDGNITRNWAKALFDGLHSKVASKHNENL